MGIAALLALMGGAWALRPTCGGPEEAPWVRHCTERPDEPPMPRDKRYDPGLPKDTTEEPPCDEDDPACDEEEISEEPFCRQDDEAIDELARKAARELRAICFRNGMQTEPEHAFMIYQDQVGSFSLGNLCTGDENGTPNMNEIYLDGCVENDGRTRHEVVGSIHCGQRWSSQSSDGDRSDDAVLRSYGSFLTWNRMST